MFTGADCGMAIRESQVEGIDPTDEAKAALQQQELDSELVVGSSHPSASASKCRGAQFFAPFSRVFSKKNKPGRFSLSVLRPAQRSGARRAGYQVKTGGRHARKSR